MKKINILLTVFATACALIGIMHFSTFGRIAGAGANVDNLIYQAQVIKNDIEEKEGQLHNIRCKVIGERTKTCYEGNQDDCVELGNSLMIYEAEYKTPPKIGCDNHRSSNLASRG